MENHDNFFIRNSLHFFRTKFEFLSRIRVLPGKRQTVIWSWVISDPWQFPSYLRSCWLGDSHRMYPTLSNSIGEQSRLSGSVALLILSTIALITSCPTGSEGASGSQSKQTHQWASTPASLQVLSSGILSKRLIPRDFTLPVRGCFQSRIAWIR